MSDPHRIDFLIYPQFMLMDLTGPLSVFASANTRSGRVLYDLRTIAQSAGLVRSCSGLEVVAQTSFAEAAQDGADTLLAVGSSKPGLMAAMRNEDLIGYLDEAFERCQRMVSVCSGAFLLAETGRLGGHRATTHWNSTRRLAARYPRVEVDDDAIFVQSGNIWTSAGVTAGIDIALALVEADHGRQLALSVARHLVVPRMRPGGQSQYSAELEAQGTTTRHLNLLAEAIRENPQGDWSVERMSEHTRVSRRTLTRLCRDELDTSPAALAERIRLDIARDHLLETDWPLDRVARGSGFGSLQRMDRAFSRHMGVTPRAYRRRFRSPYQRELIP